MDPRPGRVGPHPAHHGPGRRHGHRPHPEPAVHDRGRHRLGHRPGSCLLGHRPAYRLDDHLLGLAEVRPPVHPQAHRPGGRRPRRPARRPDGPPARLLVADDADLVRFRGLCRRPHEDGVQAVHHPCRPRLDRPDDRSGGLRRLVRQELAGAGGHRQPHRAGHVRARVRVLPPGQGRDRPAAGSPPQAPRRRGAARLHGEL